MTIEQILTAWDHHLPGVAYPSSWCLHYWKATFASEELNHALEVARHTADKGRLKDNNYAAYITGVLRNTRVQDDEVKALIAAHRAKKVHADVKP